MISYQHLKHPKDSVAKQKPFSLFLAHFARLISPNSSIGAKLRFYHSFIHFLQVIGAELIKKFNLDKSLTKGLHLNHIHNLGEERIVRALFHFLHDLDLLNNSKSVYYLTPLGKKLVRSSSHIQYKSYFFITDLIAKYRNIKSGNASKKTDIWTKLIQESKLDYEIRLCETLIQLKNINLDEKYKPTFSESYYTGSGENAFNNLTKERFQVSLESVFSNCFVNSVL